MKKLLFIICTIFITGSLIAQEETDVKTYRHSVGANIKSIIGLSDFGFFVTTPSPYSFSYRYDRNEWGLRVGYGGSYNSDKSESSESESENKYSRSLTDLRIGLDKKILSFKGFTGHMGVDFVFNSTGNKNEYQITGQSQSTINENSTFHYGLGPVIVIQYHINDRISLATESSMYFTRYNGTSKSINANNNWAEQKTESSGWSSRLYEASSLFLSIRF